VRQVRAGRPGHRALRPAARAPGADATDGARPDRAAADWSSLFGYVLFIGALSAGYFYNLTFVQLGLVDLGTRVLGLPEGRVAADLAVLAAFTLVVALVTGFLMHRTGASARFVVKLRLLFAAVVIQTALTAAAPHLRTEPALLAWIVIASVGLGIGVPSMFGLTCDLIPTRDRGYVAAVVTSAAFLPAAVFSTDWTIEDFASQLMWVMVAGTVALGVLAFVPMPVTAALARQHALPQFGVGRFVRHRSGARGPGPAFAVALVLMFGIYFVDSLGFLRIVDAPVYTVTAWHSTDPSAQWTIGGMHVLAAVIAGILYPALRQRALFVWIFALFVLAQLSYALHSVTTPDLPPPLGVPLLYAMAVSIYTVLNFTLWADFSTPATIARNTALGVGVSGWLATFLSTSLSIWWRAAEVPFDAHLRAVAAVSLVFLVVALGLLALPTRRTTPAHRRGPT
jgi:MFS family permease